MSLSTNQLNKLKPRKNYIYLYITDPHWRKSAAGAKALTSWWKVQVSHWQSPPWSKLIGGWPNIFPAGRKVFQNFLRSEFSEENILFWLACEDLKKENSPELVEEKARLIYEDYISILSPREVSLDSRVREIVNRNMIEPTTHTFDEAQIQIYTLMHRDSYPRWVLFRQK